MVCSPVHGVTNVTVKHMATHFVHPVPEKRIWCLAPTAVASFTLLGLMGEISSLRNRCTLGYTPTSSTPFSVVTTLPVIEVNQKHTTRRLHLAATKTRGLRLLTLIGTRSIMGLKADCSLVASTAVFGKVAMLFA